VHQGRLSAARRTVLDPFGGAGTTGLVADRLGRNAILIELNPEYAKMARRRIEGDAPLFTEVA
jgi:DNA modification methylase